MINYTVDEIQILQTQANLILQSDILGRSHLLKDLFNFLITRSIEGTPPKETKIAYHVFGKRADFDTSSDSSVRVYVHRLRKKIDEYYSQNFKTKIEYRLELLKGEYRFQIVAHAHPFPETTDSFPQNQKKNLLIFSAGLLLILLLNSALWGYYINIEKKISHTSPYHFARAHPLWQTLRDSSRSTIIVMGDYYIFGEKNDQGNVQRLIREFDVNSSGELNRKIIENSNHINNYLDMGLHYIPSSSAVALRNILPLLQTSDNIKYPIRVIPMSQLDGEIFKNNNIVYIGYLSGLGMLEDIVFKGGRLTLGLSYDELIDSQTGENFSSDANVTVAGGSSHRDYAYLAALSAPNDTRLIIVSGTRDAGLLQASENFGNKSTLALIDQKLDNSFQFEVLYQVNVLDNLNIGSTLILAEKK